MSRKTLTGLPDDRAALSVRETCAVLGCSRVWIYSLMRRGRLRTIKIGGKRLVPTTAIAELLDQRDVA